MHFYINTLMKIPERTLYIKNIIYVVSRKCNMISTYDSRKVWSAPARIAAHYKPFIAFLACTHYGQKWQKWPKGRKGLR